MPRSKEISHELRKKIVEAHEAGKGYKTISKVYDVHRSTVRQIIYKWKVFNTTATRPRSGRPTKLDIILRQVRKSGPGDQNGKVTREDEKERAKEEESEHISDSDSETEDRSSEEEEEETVQISGADTSSERSNVKDDVLHSTRPTPHNGPAVTRAMPRRTGGHKVRTKDSEPVRKCNPGPAEHHQEMILCCEICGACFPTEPDLESHQAQHLDKMLHECKECGKTFQSAAGLKTHKRRKHGC